MDEIVAGFRGQPRSVYIYSYDAATKHWTRSDLDKGGMGAAACAVADLNQDGRPDIACIDSTPPQVVRKCARPLTGPFLTLVLT